MELLKKLHLMLRPPGQGIYVVSSGPKTTLSSHALSLWKRNFSQISKAKQEFDNMFKLLSHTTKSTLAISYADNSIIKPIQKLVEIAQKYYFVTKIENGYIHSAQGSRYKENGKGKRELLCYLAALFWPPKLWN